MSGLLSITVPEGYDAPELQAKPDEYIGLECKGMHTRVRVHHVDDRTIYFYPEAHKVQ